MSEGAMPLADAAVSAPIARPRAVTRWPGDDLRFYERMAYACALVAFGGFVPTYWVPVATGTFAGAPVLHVHGLLFSAWTVLFVVQTRLAARGRLRSHRRLGMAGIAVATAMLFVGLKVVAGSIDAGIARGAADEARAFAIVPTTLIVGFALLVGAAIAFAHRRDVHMRLMLVATIAILPPAIARVVLLLLAPEGAGAATGVPPPLGMTLVPAFLADLLLLVAMAHDWRRRGRPHSAYIITGVVMLVVQVARVPLARTPTWLAITGWLA
jgi:hypothetical protein